MPSFTFKSIDVPAAEGTYTYTGVTGVDSAGEAVGYYGYTDGDDDGYFHGFVTQESTGVTFDPPGSTNNVGMGITASGEIFGEYIDNKNQQHGFVDDNGAVNPVDVFLGTGTTIAGIDTAGDIYGTFVSGGQLVLGFVDQNGTYSDVFVQGSSSTSVAGINASGEIVGTWTDASFQQHGFDIVNGVTTTIDAPNAYLTSVVGVSDDGTVVGDFEDMSDYQHGFIDKNGVVSQFDVAGSIQTGINGVNAAGEVVGYYIDASEHVHGFIDNNGTVTTVDVPGATQTNINGVTDAGVIYGYYDDTTGTQHGFVGDPAETKFDFYAVESKTGDIIEGYVYDSSGQYSVGWQQTLPTDADGGNWTYHIYQADATNAPLTSNQSIFDTGYYDAATKTWNNTLDGANGTASGTHGIGSDTDYAIYVDQGGHAITPVNLAVQEFGDNGYHVATQSSMEKYDFYAIESATGDVATGYVYDSSGEYSVGWQKTLPTDADGGNWTYHVYQAEATSGPTPSDQTVFDTGYYDAAAKTWNSTLNGANGTASGTHGIGSDTDYAIYVDQSGHSITPVSLPVQQFGDNGYHVATQSIMEQYDFYAVESATGDVFTGYVDDPAGTYAVGSQKTLPIDEEGGNWTYHIYQTEATNAPASSDQFVFDTGYYDAQTQSWGSTLYGDNGFASGKHDIGSDGDTAIFVDQNNHGIAPNNQVMQQFGYDGYEVADQSGLQKFDFYAVESVTNDVIAGSVYSKPGVYSDGAQFTFSNDQDGGSWTYHVYQHENTNVPLSQNGAIYDTAYYNAPTQEWGSTLNGAAGIPSGTAGIGSDRDYAVFYDAQQQPLPIDTHEQLFGGGYYVAGHII